MSRIGRVLLMAVLLSFALGASAQEPCIDQQDFMCGHQCEYWGGWYCASPSNPDRACWSSGTGNSCGESSTYDLCNCTGYGGGF
jgi:hypothetical protein